MSESKHRVIGYLQRAALGLNDTATLYDERLEDDDIPVVAPWGVAAATDLLLAAKSYIAQIDAIGLPDDDVTSSFRAAIAKAEGRS